MKVEAKRVLLKKQARDIGEGAAIYAGDLALTEDFAGSLSSTLTALETAEEEHHAQKQALGEKSRVRNLAAAAVQQFVTSATQILKPRFGNEYNGRWTTVGVNGQTIATPSNLQALMERGSAYQAYFAANPTHGMESLNVTAAKAGAVIEAFADADAAYNHALTLIRNAAEAVSATTRQLQKCVRAAMNALATKLAEDDNRWFAFGLPRPSDTRIPAVPQGMTLVQHGPGQVLASWTKAVRARRYRVFVQKPGSESAAVATVRELSALVSALPSGVPLRFTVAAANSTGESLPGEVVEMTLA